MDEQNTPLKCIIFQICPYENRYQAFACDGDENELLTEGWLEKLTQHLPQLKDFYSGGSKVNVILQWPTSSSVASWFTKSTFRRFLGIVNSSGVFDGTKVNEDEICQLEKSRKFHLSLYSQAQSHKHASGSVRADGDNQKSASSETNSKSEIENASSSSDTSKNELLRAMDLRLKVLRNQLAAYLEQVAGSCSSKDISHMLLCCQNLGAIDLKNYLIKYSELIGIRLMLDNPSGEKPSFVNANGCDVETEARTKRTKLGCPVVLEDHSNLSSKVASPRGSASPMSRGQIARVGSHRDAAIDIKNLNHIFVREKTPSHTDRTANNSDEEISGKLQKKPETNGRKMSVQSVISLFESTQREDNVVPDTKKRSPGDKPKNAKPVRRKWNYCVDQYHMHCTAEADTDSNSLTSEASLSDTKVREVGNEEQESTDIDIPVYLAAEVDSPLQTPDTLESPAPNTQDFIKPTGIKNGTERLIASANWKQQREAEFSMLKKMIEVKPVKNRRTGASKKITCEQRGGFYDDYKKKRDKKLKGEHAAKKAVREAQFEAINQIIEESKVQMSSKDGKRQSVHNAVPSVTKLPLESLNAAKKTPKGAKPAVAKREAMKPPSVPGARKSLSSAPSPQSRKLSHSTNSNIVPSAATTTHRKSHPLTSLASQYSKVDKPLPRKNALQTEPRSNLQGAMDMRSQPLARDTHLSKSKIRPTPENLLDMATAKTGLPTTRAKKNTVVPVESKSFLRKVSKVGTASVTSDNKCKTSPRSKEYVRKSGNSPSSQEREVAVQSPEQVDKHEIKDIVCDHGDSTLLETLVNDHQTTFDPKTPSKVNADDATNMAAVVSPFSVEKEETSISPSAWVEVEESSDLPIMPIPIDDNEVQLSYPQPINTVETANLCMRLSLSQMLQDEINERENTAGWGNAENLSVFRPKNSPRGFKRFLKFGRKSKDGNSSGRHYTR